MEDAYKEPWRRAKAKRLCGRYYFKFSAAISVAFEPAAEWSEITNQPSGRTLRGSLHLTFDRVVWAYPTLGSLAQHLGLLWSHNNIGEAYERAHPRPPEDPWPPYAAEGAWKYRLGSFLLSLDVDTGMQRCWWETSPFFRELLLTLRRPAAGEVERPARRWRTLATGATLAAVYRQALRSLRSAQLPSSSDEIDGESLDSGSSGRREEEVTFYCAQDGSMRVGVLVVNMTRQLALVEKYLGCRPVESEMLRFLRAVQSLNLAGDRETLWATTLAALDEHGELQFRRGDHAGLFAAPAPTAPPLWVRARSGHTSSYIQSVTRGYVKGVGGALPALWPRHWDPTEAAAPATPTSPSRPTLHSVSVSEAGEPMRDPVLRLLLLRPPSPRAGLARVGPSSYHWVDHIPHCPLPLPLLARPGAPQGGVAVRRAVCARLDAPAGDAAAALATEAVGYVLLLRCGWAGVRGGAQGVDDASPAGSCAGAGSGAAAAAAAESSVAAVPGGVHGAQALPSELYVPASPVRAGPEAASAAAHDLVVWALQDGASTRELLTSMAHYYDRVMGSCVQAYVGALGARLLAGLPRPSREWQWNAREHERLAEALAAYAAGVDAAWASVVPSMTLLQRTDGARVPQRATAALRQAFRGAQLLPLTVALVPASDDASTPGTVGEEGWEGVAHLHVRLRDGAVGCALGGAGQAAARLRTCQVLLLEEVGATHPSDAPAALVAGTPCSNAPEPPRKLSLEESGSPAEDAAAAAASLSPRVLRFRSSRHAVKTNGGGGGGALNGDAMVEEVCITATPWLIRPALPVDVLVDGLLLPPLTQCIDAYLRLAPTSDGSAVCAGLTTAEVGAVVGRDLRALLRATFTDPTVRARLAFVGDALIDLMSAIHTLAPTATGAPDALWKGGPVTGGTRNETLCARLPESVRGTVRAVCGGVARTKTYADFMEAMFGALTAAVTGLFYVRAKTIAAREPRAAGALGHIPIPHTGLLIASARVLLCLLNISFTDTGE